MKQKKDGDQFTTQEDAKFKSDWDYTAPAESLEHILKVNDNQKNRGIVENNRQMEKVEERKKFLVQEKNADRAVQNERINADLNAVESEQKEIRQLKQQMQAVNKQVWLDQIELTRMHKKLNIK